MYSKKPVAKYQYNDPEPAELAQVLSPEHTALIIIDMQNDFASDQGQVRSRWQRQHSGEKHNSRLSKVAYGGA